MKSLPYVGITGPVTVHEVQDICREFEDANYTMNSPHIPMLGFLVSHKTLQGQPTDNRRYPSVRNLKDLIQATEGKVLNMIHYNSRDTSDLADQVKTIFNNIYKNNLCKSIQLNIVWPDISQVRKIKEIFPELQIVLQASENAMKGKSAREIADGVKAYGDAINYVLIDPSGGKGLPFDLESSIDIYSELKAKTPNLTIGFAGGFNGENTAERLKDVTLFTEKQDFCIDAEGGLRDKVTSKYGDDLLNIEKVRSYLQAAATVFE